MRLLALAVVIALSGCSSPKTCTPASCPMGCCANDTCVSGDATTACGAAGADCVSCSDGGVFQQLVCTTSQQCGACGPDNCIGCCAGDVCKPKVPDDSSCGELGAACVDCADAGQACNGTSFACEGGPEPLGGDGKVVALNVAVDNLYADSIFTLAITIDAPDGGATPVDGAVPFGQVVQVLNGQHIAFETTDKFPASAQIDPRAQLSITAAVESLGQTTNYTGTTTLAAATLTKDTLTFVYDFDAATAKFDLRYGWLHLP